MSTTLCWWVDDCKVHVSERAWRAKFVGAPGKLGEHLTWENERKLGELGEGKLGELGEIGKRSLSANRVNPRTNAKLGEGVEWLATSCKTGSSI